MRPWCSFAQVSGVHYVVLLIVVLRIVLLIVLLRIVVLLTFVLVDRP